MKRVLFIFGTRPEAIKLAPLINKFKQTPKFKVKICVTAQHRQMLDQILTIFKIKPDYDLQIMRPGQTLFDITSIALKKIEKILLRERPAYVFVQGDTTTALVGSLAAFYLKIPVCHIEAGLRTQDKYAPFPEEINRRIASVIAEYHFAPTLEARKNLLKENIPGAKIFVTGNTVIDALLSVVKRINSTIVFSKPIDFSKKVILVTGHRRENFGKRFEDICRALKIIANNNPDCEIVYPVHLNPNVQRPVYKIIGKVANIKLLEPVDYLEFVYLLKAAYLIITDSGGVQEEAPTLGKPVLVMREVTERPEAVKAGTVKLVGTDPKKIVRECERLLRNKEYYQKMSRAHNPYGDGQAAARIVKIITGLK